ncbi:hypothetical protein [Opitutus terrae]|uniref:hypothetical protein n=1 Tax=Opitutus terrae TaxID=107709 RepID=UPI0013051B1F|nr:hypothetical protein [Opitutus terrae]
MSNQHSRLSSQVDAPDRFGVSRPKRAEHALEAAANHRIEFRADCPVRPGFLPKPLHSPTCRRAAAGAIRHRQSENAVKPAHHALATSHAVAPVQRRRQASLHEIFGRHRAPELLREQTVESSSMRKEPIHVRGRQATMYARLQHRPFPDFARWLEPPSRPAGRTASRPCIVITASILWMDNNGRERGANSSMAARLKALR